MTRLRRYSGLPVTPEIAPLAACLFPAVRNPVHPAALADPSAGYPAEGAAALFPVSRRPNEAVPMRGRMLGARRRRRRVADDRVLGRRDDGHQQGKSQRRESCGSNGFHGTSFGRGGRFLSSVFPITDRTIVLFMR